MTREDELVEEVLRRLKDDPRVLNSEDQDVVVPIGSVEVPVGARVVREYVRTLFPP
jgi:hypothetical protein